MTKKLIMIVVLLLLLPWRAGAVLKERNLAKTLDVLEVELERSHNEWESRLQMYEQNTRKQHTRLVETMQQIDEVSIVLYSQKRDFTFDMAYACQQATDLYRNNRLERIPYQRIVTTLNSEIERYDSMIVILRNLSPTLDAHRRDSVSAVDTLINDLIDESPRKADLFTLNEKQQEQRERCLSYATAIRDHLELLVTTIGEDQHYYDLVTAKLEAINRYALRRYEDLRHSIFDNGGQNYFQTLASLPQSIRRSKMDLGEKYEMLQRKSDGKPVNSDWRGPVLLGTSIFVLFYIAIASVLSFFILRWLLPRRWRESEAFKKKRSLIGVACGVFLFTLCISAARTFIYHNFISMAIGIIIGFAWLIEVILVSLVIRLNDKQLWTGVKAYTPFLLMAFIVIVFRIVFIPNNVVRLIYPPLLLVFTIWQYRMIKKRKQKLPDSDMFCSLISLLAMIVSCVLSWLGYTLMAVQIMIWWSFQLACIQTIICLYDLARMYEEKQLMAKVRKAEIEAAALRQSSKKHKKGEKTQGSASVQVPELATLLKRARNGEYIQHTWGYDFYVKALLPVAAVMSVLLSIVLAAQMFDMSELFVKAFFYSFVDKEGLLQLSLYKLVLVGSLFFIFRYLTYMGHSFYRLYKTRRTANDVTRSANFTLANNIISIGLWGIYFLLALFVFQVPKSGISLITAGLATGLGFAMKDILENFIYGLNLMSGRVRVGDYIECDGILGKVDRISYQSTQIVTLEGSVIAFLNSQLFTKNFKNLTRNNSYELVKIPVGVAYGADVDKVRSMLVEELSKLPVTRGGRTIIQKKQGFKVLFGDFGDSSVDLQVAFWVLVEEKITFEAQVKETIYNTLQRNKVEIPFPQQDVYIRHIETPPVVVASSEQRTE